MMSHLIRFLSAWAVLAGAMFFFAAWTPGVVFVNWVAPLELVIEAGLLALAYTLYVAQVTRARAARRNARA